MGAGSSRSSFNVRGCGRAGKTCATISVNFCSLLQSFKSSICYPLISGLSHLFTSAGTLVFLFTCLSIIASTFTSLSLEGTHHSSNFVLCFVTFISPSPNSLTIQQQFYTCYCYSSQCILLALCTDTMHYLFILPCHTFSRTGNDIPFHLVEPSVGRPRGSKPPGMGNWECTR